MAEGSLGAPCGDSPWSYVPPLRLGEGSELAIRDGDDVLSGRSVARAIGDAVARSALGVVESHRKTLDQALPGNLRGAARVETALRDLADGRFESLSSAPVLAFARPVLKPGFYFVSAHVETAATRGRVTFEFSGLGEDAPAYRFGLATRSQHPVFRIVRVPPVETDAGSSGSRYSLRLSPTDAPGPFTLHSVRVVPVPERFAVARMRRRIVSAGAAQGRSLSTLRAESASLTGDALWARYDRTFPRGERQISYAGWIAAVESPLMDAYLKEADVTLARLAAGTPSKQRPRVSVLVPVCDPRPEDLRACLRSALDQVYPEVEVCVADDASTDPAVHAVLDELSALDARLRVVRRATRGHLSAATNEALAIARGELIALLEHDDTLAPDALLHMVDALAEAPEAIFAYSDEDALDERGERCDPHFKPQWNPEYLLSGNYVGHLVVARTDAVRAQGGLRVGYEGSQSHDLLLRLTDEARSGQVVHVPHVLYHGRRSAGFTAAGTDTKPNAAGAGLRAVADAAVRRGIAAEVRHVDGVAFGYRLVRALPVPPPKVSIIMPTRDGGSVLARAVDGVLAGTDYANLELLLIDNGSTCEQTLGVLARAAEDPRVQVLRDDSPFNFSALNNRAAAKARGDVFVLLNDDVEVLPDQADWLRELASYALVPEIGCVGAKLLYPDGTVQHGGVILGIGGVARHAHKRFPAAHCGYFGRLQLTHALSAVTAACLAVRRDVWEAMGGLDEGLAVAFNDVDFCLRVREAGYRNVFTPHAVLVHHESVSRGSDHTPARRERFTREVRFMAERWGDALLRDPYYSRHLTLDHEDFAIAQSD